MKYTYNKSRPEIEYGMVCQRKLNGKKRKAGADGLVTYYYVSPSPPLSGRYYHNGGYYVIPVKITPEYYAELVALDVDEHNNNHKHDRRYLDIEKYYRRKGDIDEDDVETNAWECLADKKTIYCENDIINEIDKAAAIEKFSELDKQIYHLYANGLYQSEIAKIIGKTQSFVSKRLTQLTEQIEKERFDDGSRTEKELSFCLAWEKFLYCHTMSDCLDVIFETFNYLIGERMLEEFLIYFYSFGEYYRYAYKLLYLYEPTEEDVLGLINELPLPYRYLFFDRNLDEQADIFIWLYYRLVTETERRRQITPEPNQTVYERLIAEQEKIAKRVKLTATQFTEKRFIPKVAPMMKKRSDEFMKANNVYIFDESADIKTELKKLFGKPK